MFMISDAEFLDLVNRRWPVKYASSAKFARAVGVTPQTFQNWKQRGKVADRWKPVVADLLGINWLSQPDQVAEDSAGDKWLQPKTGDMINQMEDAESLTVRDLNLLRDIAEHIARINKSHTPIASIGVNSDPGDSDTRARKRARRPGQSSKSG